MILRVLGFLSRVLPGVKRSFWRTGYQVLARRYQQADWGFMNYGFAELDGESSPRLEADEEPERFCLQLYAHVVAQRQLSDRDIVEVGCGRGGGAAYLARHHSPHRVLGIDFSERAVQLCRRRGTAGLQFLVGDAEALPLADSSADVAVNIESSHCYGSMPRFLGEVRRVLRRGGSLLFADFRAGEALDRLRGEFRSSGLDIVRETVITPQVVRALDLDSDRREAFIRASVPRPMQEVARTFAGVAGTAMYAALRSGSVQYISAELRRP